MATPEKRRESLSLFETRALFGSPFAVNEHRRPTAQKSFENLRQIAAQQARGKKGKTPVSNRHPVSALKRTGNKLILGLHKTRGKLTFITKWLFESLDYFAKLTFGGAGHHDGKKAEHRRDGPVAVPELVSARDEIHLQARPNTPILKHRIELSEFNFTTSHRASNAEVNGSLPSPSIDWLPSDAVDSLLKQTLGAAQPQVDGTEPTSLTGNEVDGATNAFKGKQADTLSFITSGLGHSKHTGSLNPTIVHRPNLRTAASALFNHHAPSIGSSPTQSVNTGLTSQSSHGPISTTQTSLESALSKLARSAELKDNNALQSAVAGSLYKMFPLVSSGDNSPPSPTIKTVELTANARIFIETHFNQILNSDQTPREKRLEELESTLKRSQSPPDECSRQRRVFHRQESDFLRQTRIQKSQEAQVAIGKEISLQGWTVVKVLGKGSFGVVRLVREKSDLIEEKPSRGFNRGSETFERLTSLVRTGSRPLRKRKQVFAMKVIRKSEMIRNSQEGHIRAERDFLVASEKSRWIVLLLASFQDKDNL